MMNQKFHEHAQFVFNLWFIKSQVVDIACGVDHLAASSQAADDVPTVMRSRFWFAFAGKPRAFSCNMRGLGWGCYIPILQQNRLV